MKIRTWPKDHEALREVAQPVEVENINGVFGGNRMQRFIDRLYKTMRRYEGIGIAANQVGISQRIIIVGKTVIVNPVIEQDDIMVEKTGSEGCLSFPGTSFSVMRKVLVYVTGLDRHGNPLNFMATGDTARCIQHEVDHLNGNLVIDKGGLLTT